ncbi:MAG: DUF3667 domain-containing protein [Mucilaginibacter polytrichastri]|nr:DUF3667 domain-containing protein [Mucilaginibacter polytrichastri]
MHLAAALRRSGKRLMRGDEGVLKLIKDLVRRPGAAYHHYFSGGHKRYVHPVLFLAVTAGLAGWLYPFVFDYEDSVNKMNNEFGRILAGRLFYREFLVMIIMGAMTKICFYRRFTFAETLTFWMFCLGLTCVVRLVCIPLYFPLIAHKATLDYGLNVLVAGIVLWQLIAVFGRKNPGSTILSLVLIIVYLLVDACVQGYLLYDLAFVFMLGFSTFRELLDTLFGA